MLIDIAEISMKALDHNVDACFYVNDVACMSSPSGLYVPRQRRQLVKHYFLEKETQP